MNLFVNVMIPLGHRRRRPSPAEMAHYRAALATRERRHANAVLPQAITGSRAFLQEVADGLGAVADLPALLLWGDADIAFREAERRRWQERLAHRADVTLSGAGHFVQSDAPDEFADAIRRWWSEGDRAGGAR